MDQDKKEIEKLVEEAMLHFKNNESEQAEALGQKILELDPDSLDGHYILAEVAGLKDDQRYIHYKFILDHDIGYLAPGATKYDLLDDFLRLLRIKSYDCKEDQRHNLILNEIIEYSVMALKTGSRISEIVEFVDVLEEAGRYEDLINIGCFLTEDKKAGEIGLPGLEYSKKHDDLEMSTTHVMGAFFELERYEEGCRWIHKCLLLDKEDHMRWYLLGEALAWMGYPEETARAWIISVEKGNHIIPDYVAFETLTSMMCDVNYEEKEKLRKLVRDLKSILPPEKHKDHEEVMQLIYASESSNSEELPSIRFIENKLGVKLNEIRQNDYKKGVRLHIGPRSNAEIVRDVINTMDEYIGISLKNENKLPETQVKKTKVVVGEGAAIEQTITLAHYGINVTGQVRNNEIPLIVGRDREIDRMVRILARSEKNNPALLGEAGVGKTAAVYGLAQRIVSGNVPDILRNKTIIELNVGALVAGTTYRGDFEERMNKIIKEMRDNPDIVLFIDEFHTLVGAGDSRGQMDASNILKPALSSGEIRIIGATTSREYAKSIERDAAFERRFSPVYLNEISQQITFNVLKARVPRWEQHYLIRIDDALLTSAIHLTVQHVKHRHLPDKAIDLIDEACALARMKEQQGEDGQIALKHDRLKEIVDQWMGATAMKGDVPDDYLGDIEKEFHKWVVGHKDVIRELTTIVADEKLGLNFSRLPRVLYFYGLPDTGKTQCARTLSKLLWPEEQERFLHINMELLKNSSDLNRLMGAPSGTAGSDDGGRLSLFLTRNPYGVVYLYNFHKAHDRIIKFFTGIFREGLFSDGTGRTIYAQNAIFILSATINNLGAKIGFNRHSEKIKSDSFTKHVPQSIQALNLSSDVFHFVKRFYSFDELNSNEITELVVRKMEEIMNMPGIRERKTVFESSLVDEIVKHYEELPPERRNLRGVLQKFVYDEIAGSAS